MGANKRSGRSLVRWIGWSAALSILAVRYGWMIASKPHITDGNRVRITLVVKEIPRQQWGKSDLRLDDLEITLAGGKNLEYGDILTVQGVVHGNTLEAESWKVEKHQGRYLLRDWRHKMQSLIMRFIPGDEGALASGIVLGGSEVLSRRGEEEFKRAGLTHVVAASGYNVAVVAGWIMPAATALLGVNRGRWLAILGIWTYTGLAGGEAAVVRAAVMGTAVLAGQSAGRKAFAARTLAVAVWLMLFWNPGWINDIGFQLSLAATAGLIWTGGWFTAETYPSKKGLIPLLAGDLKTTMAAQMLTVPLILHYFGGLSWVSPLVNTAVLWTVPISMQIVGFALGVGLFWRDGGRLVALCAWPFLRWMTWFVGEASSRKWVMWELGKISWGWVAGYYLAVWLVLRYFRRKNN